MGLLPRSLTVLLLLLLHICSSWLPYITSQSTNGSLDSLLQEYSYKGFGNHPKTGISYDGPVPTNLTGIKVTALRLRSGSLRRKGVASYKEFSIPIGVIVTPYVERLVLVYQNLGNWSEFYYPLDNYTYLAPVLGLRAYDAANLSATRLPELDFRAFGDPVSISFSDVRRVISDVKPKCVQFGQRGQLNFSDVVSDNMCFTAQPGHFSIVVKSSALSPSPSPSPPKEVANSPNTPGHGKKKKVWIIAGSVVGGLAVMVALSFLAVWAQRYKERRQVQRTEMVAEAGEPLNMVPIRDARAPAAQVTRTQPMLEDEYVL